MLIDMTVSSMEQKLSKANDGSKFKYADSRRNAWSFKTAECKENDQPYISLCHFTFMESGSDVALTNDICTITSNSDGGIFLKTPVTFNSNVPFIACDANWVYGT